MTNIVKIVSGVNKATLNDMEKLKKLDDVIAKNRNVINKKVASFNKAKNKINNKILTNQRKLNETVNVLKSRIAEVEKMKKATVADVTKKFNSIVGTKNATNSHRVVPSGIAKGGISAWTNQGLLGISPQVETAQKQFVEWLRIKDPVLYNMALKRMARKQKMSGFLDIFKSVVDVVKDVGPKVVEMTNQKKILDAQIKAAQAGQAPLNIPYTPVVANPNSAQAQNVINAGANYGMPDTGSPFNRNLMLLGIPVLLGAWWLLRRKRR